MLLIMLGEQSLNLIDSYMYLHVHTKLVTKTTIFEFVLVPPAGELRTHWSLHNV